MLKSTGPTIKEWYEGFEELRSIPHSFALVFTNGEPPLMFFSDTAPEKVWILQAHIASSDSSASGFALRSSDDMSESMIIISRMCTNSVAYTYVIPAFFSPLLGLYNIESNSCP